jgi:hypothetical protein
MRTLSPACHASRCHRQGHLDASPCCTFSIKVVLTTTKNNKHNIIIMTWAYLPVLNSLIQIIVTILIGYCSEAFGIIPAALFVPQAVNVVFKILLPCLIIKGVGTGIDFYAEKNVWTFIVACEL